MSMQYIYAQHKTYIRMCMYVYTYTHALTTSRYPVGGVLPLRLSTKAIHLINKNYTVKPQHYHHDKHNLMLLQELNT